MAQLRAAAAVAWRAGIGVGQTGAPTKGAAASGDGGASRDDVVHEVNGQGVHRASGSDDGVLVNGQTGKAAQAALTRGFHGICTRYSAFDAAAGDKPGNGARKGEVGREAAVTGWNWNQPAMKIEP